MSWSSSSSSWRCFVGLSLWLSLSDCIVDFVLASSFEMDPNASLWTYLHPKLLQDESWLEEIAQSLRAGELVVIENAFQEDFAEYVHGHLVNLEDDDWKLLTGSFEDGFHFHHHNIQEDQFTPILQEVYNMFAHEDSKAFMEEWSGRDCSGESLSASASYYQPGDHSLPHADTYDQRSLAFVWHLTKDWKPEWGGALYWLPSHSTPLVHADFNRLLLFSVTPVSEHFVTSVSLETQDGKKRLAFNGWYESDPSWKPSLENPDDLEYLLDLDPDDVWNELTQSQMESITDLDVQDFFTDNNDNTEAYEHLLALQEQILALLERDDQGVYYVNPVDFVDDDDNIEKTDEDMEETRLMDAEADEL